ncbi:MAG: hypothetical protein JRF69_05680 [Deltaproteobacteria bacterium]|nr:hypothetical protein [Deltaproteobacteria bacterium]
MDPQARRRLIAVFAFIAGALIVCAFCAQQYFTYRSESQSLTAAIRWVDHQLRKVQAVERQPGRLSQAIKGVEEKLSQQRLQVPATLDVGGFLDHFSAMASRFEVEVKASQRESSSRDFYDQATLRIKLAGEDKDVEALLEKLSTGDRLTRYKVLQCANRECDIELSIFSIPEPEEEPLSVFDMQACAEFNSKVWLWPFTDRIQDRYEELNSLCIERQRQSSAIRSTEELMGKLRLSRFIGEVIKHLAPAETSQQAE